MPKLKTITNNEASMTSSELVKMLNFEDLMIWWVSIICLVLSVIFYVTIPISPIRELIILGAVIFFIVTTIIKFFK